MAKHEFTISAADLDAAGKEFTFPVTAAWIRGALEDHEATALGTDGLLKVRASKSGADVVVHGTLKAELTTPCARCLEPVAIHVDQQISALMVPAATMRAETAEELEFGSDEADTFPFEGDTVVLDDFIRDELVLETPMIPLCSEDCPGMSPVPADSSEEAVGKAPVDPRLLPLLQFQNRTKKNTT